MRKHRSNTRFNGTVAGHLHAGRASAKDIHSRVRVGMRNVSAIDAVKDRLALAAQTVHGPAFRTGLRGIGGVDIFDAPAARLKLVFQHGREGRPALRQDRSVEAALAGTAGSHVGHPELLQRHHAEATGDIRRSLVQPVIARGRSVRVMLGDYQALASPARRSFLAPAEDALGSLPLLGCHSNVRGHLVMLAGRKAEGVRNAAVDANAIRRSRVAGVGAVPGARGIPGTGYQLHRYGLDAFRHGASEAQLYRATLREMDKSPLPIEHRDGAISTLNPKAVRNATYAHGRISAAAGEEVLESDIEILQGTFAKRARRGIDPIDIRTKLRDLFALRSPRNAPAHLGSKLAPVIAPLLERQIVDETRSACELAKRLILLCSGINPVSIGTFQHAFTVADSPFFTTLKENDDVG